MPKFSPVASPANFSTPPRYVPLSLTGSPWGQSSVPVTVSCFCASSSFSPKRCSTVNVQVPAMDFSLAWTAGSDERASPTATTLAILKDLIEWNTEHLRDPEGDFERGRIFPELDRVDGLTGDADPVGELLLRHLLAVEPQPADVVLDRLRHQASRRYRTIWMPNLTSSVVMIALMSSCAMRNRFAPGRCMPRPSEASVPMKRT